MNVLAAVTETVNGYGPFNVLEWSFLVVLTLALGATGVFGLVVVARLVEPRGVRALLRRLTGRD